MGQTFFEKWRHRIRDAWMVLTGRAWVGYGLPNDWQYVGPLTMTEEELLRGLEPLIPKESR